MIWKRRKVEIGFQVETSREPNQYKPEKERRHYEKEATPGHIVATRLVDFVGKNEWLLWVSSSH
jgi:hypothetical protein